MLEIKNLTKIYKTKGGADVTALDDVSVKFEETGLVFLLGKSGSGKSTLLNLAGGLDEPTSGEVIVMGKSSKEFTGSDFDSYRNTFIGFVFQEYNVLNEFNVEDNVALALELQGKTKGREKVHQILEEVELAPYAKRKPNTLSGGQKQRIAIARALVKDPQIIMADEPTGALDSATGKQVFDTLKKLSETRLVLVVSHDREFAEIYGDRIIELKDGKIISDVVKVKDAPTPLSGGLKQIGPDTLTVQAGAVDEQAMQKIRAFLSESRGEVLISRGEKEVATFRRVNRIDETGAQERFAETEEKDLDIKEYDGKETKFIRSKLPAGKAFKLGASGLKLKPFRLVFTILLSLVSFVMFGLFSTMMLYDADEVYVQSFMNSDYEYIKLEKLYQSRVYHNGEFDYNTGDLAYFTPEEVNSFGADAFGAYEAWFSFPNIQVDQQAQYYYMPEINSVAVLPENHPLRIALGSKYPKGADEIAVSSYFADCTVHSTFTPVNKKEDGSLSYGSIKNLSSPEQLIGENLVVDNELLKVTGILDFGAIPSKYDSLKESDTSSISPYQFRQFLQSSPHCVAFVSEEFLTAHRNLISNQNNIEYFQSAKDYFRLQKDETMSLASASALAVYQKGDKNMLPVLFAGEEKSSLADDEVIVHWRDIAWYIYNDLQSNSPEPDLPKPEFPALPEEPMFEAQWDWSQEEYDAAFQQFEQAHQQWETECRRLQDEYDKKWQEYVELSDRLYQEYNEKLQNIQRAISILERGAYDVNDEETGAWKEVTATAEEMQAAKTLITDLYKELGVLEVQLYKNEIEAGAYKIVGIYFTEPSFYSNNGMYCSQNFFDENVIIYEDTEWTRETKYEREEDAIYRDLYISLVKEESSFRALTARLNVVDEQTDIYYLMNNDLDDDFNFLNGMIEELSLIFLIVGLVMMLFAALLLFNFISMSITNKKKDIGILRAVGARGVDVFKIFFSESGIIVGICLVLSLIGSLALALFLNSYLKAEIGLQVTLFVFGFPSVAIMVGIALFVTFVGTFLPVFFASRKKPVESIRAL